MNDLTAMVLAPQGGPGRQDCRQTTQTAHARHCSRRDLSVLKHCKYGSTTSSTTMRLTISKRQLMKRDLQEGSPSQWHLPGTIRG